MKKSIDNGQQTTDFFCSNLKATNQMKKTKSA